MAKPQDMTAEARQGFDAGGAANPFLWSSASHMAFAVGAWLQSTGRTAPRDVRMSRGYTVRVNDMLISWNPKTGACERIS